MSFKGLNFMSKLVWISILAGSISGCAGLQENLNRTVQVINDVQSAGRGSSTTVGHSEIVQGLKEALAIGATNAINQLGQTNGYWADELVRVNTPDELSRVAKILRKTGQGQLVDEFELAMNRAAERAVPEAADIMGNAIRSMTFADARAILQGDDQAATSFFRRTTENQLFNRFYPLVQQATNRAGVTQTYKNLISQAGFIASLANLDADSLDRHVTQQALDGLFVYIAQKEREIRNNPAERTTQILREVFSR